MIESRSTVTDATTQDWGRFGPAMKALPNDAWRTFAIEFATGRQGHGALTRAARAAGFGKNSTAANLGKLAWKIAQDDRMVAAVAEVSRKLVRSGAPEAANALMNMIRDPKHRDHGRAVSMVLERADPAVAHHEVVHRVDNPDEEALEEYRALRTLGTPREKLLELFGANGLDRIERRDTVELARRAVAAKMIEHDAREVCDG